ncbi:hypothetical protein PIB30_089385, partial [Stylosanthes scabra]|nr:hypothetical protein [Stylosanthes scabra]
MALALAICEGRWLSYILKDLQLVLDKPITLFCENQAAIPIASNPCSMEEQNTLRLIVKLSE